MENIITEGRTRRDFLKGAGAVVAGGVVVGVVGSQLSCEELPGVGGVVPEWWTPGSDRLTLPPASEGYLVYDLEKCASCQSCMLTCSLVHEGKENLSYARTQRPYDTFGRFPYDVQEQFCRQCVYTPCIEACPSGAYHVDAANGNVRRIDEAACADYQASIAPATCQQCLDACAYEPTRVIWNHEKGVAMVCDLCIDAPYFGEAGGPNGKQACVEVCPLRCIRLVNEVPDQRDDAGYDLNMRTSNWLESIVTPDRYEPDARMKQRQMA
jgi:protein NrfC